MVGSDGMFFEEPGSDYISVAQFLSYKKTKPKQNTTAGLFGCLAVVERSLSTMTYFLATSRSFRAPSSGFPAALLPFGLSCLASGSAVTRSFSIS